jgi:Ser/Thr protein kinase RdoA (MazF antagonist)
MDEDALRSICLMFDLGMPRGAPVSVAGGLTNRLWRLTTETGEFAVKQMNRDPQRTDFVAWFDRAFTLELAAYRAGVPMPRPVATRDGRCLGDVESSEGTLTVRVHAWVDGTPLNNGRIWPAETIARAAKALARIHALEMATEVAAKEGLHVFGDDHWRSLADRMQAEHVDIYDEFRSLLPVLHALEEYVEEAGNDATPLVLSHRDSDMKNFVRARDGELLLVDWDAAGPVNPRHDVANNALVWAGLHLGEPDVDAVRAYADAYTGEAPPTWKLQPHDLAELVSLRLGWFEFNVHRALGERIRDDADRAVGLNVIRRNVEQLPRFLRSLNAWLAIVRPFFA